MLAAIEATFPQVHKMGFPLFLVLSLINCYYLGDKVRNIHFIHVIAGSIESRRERPLLSLLKELGGWPTLEGGNWDEANFREAI